MVLPQVKDLSAERGGFHRGLGENRLLKIEVSLWYLGLDYRRSVMVLPQVTHVATHDFERGLSEKWAVEIRVSHWYLGVISRRMGMVPLEVTCLAAERRCFDGVLGEK
jgi:hypothetical protein